MSRKIQAALGKNAKTDHPDIFDASATYPKVGQAIVDSVNGYLDWGLNHDDGSDLVRSIHSLNLRESALFSAKSARMAYLLGKATILDEQSRKGVVRTQVIEYGAVAEAILLDLVQSVGKNNKPGGARPNNDAKGRPVNWAGDGLFTRARPNSVAMRHWFDFRWLIDEANRLRVINAQVKARANWLRQSRNLVHPVIPTAQRYTDDIDSSKKAREIVIELRDAVLAYKAAHGLP
jgi:hypothetical protein